MEVVGADHIVSQRVVSDMVLRIDDFEEVKDWCVAYHGTMHHNIISIMLRGLRQPGEAGVEVLHGQASWSCQSSKSIYLSPSIEHAGHLVYAVSGVSLGGLLLWIELCLRCVLHALPVRQRVCIPVSHGCLTVGAGASG